MYMYLHRVHTIITPTSPTPPKTHPTSGSICSNGGWKWSWILPTGIAHAGISAEDRQGRYNGVGWKDLGAVGAGALQDQAGWWDPKICVVCSREPSPMHPQWHMSPNKHFLHVPPSTWQYQATPLSCPPDGHWNHLKPQGKLGIH